MKSKATVLLLFLSLFPIASFAQRIYTDSTSYTLEDRTFQLSLVPGLSTSGFDASNYAFKYSFNLIGGFTGALNDGYELGGVFNINKHYADGTQIAGVANYTNGFSSGAKFAGAANIAGNDMEGIQVAGAFNFARGYMEGVQVTGGLNLSDGAMGMQLSGAGNISSGTLEGFMVTGGLNLGVENVEGFMVAGGANIAMDYMEGFLVAGGLNYAKEMEGFVVAPINISKRFEGFQAGVINVTGEAEGLQLGVINYANDIDGAPIGVISFVKNGRHNFDVFASDGGFVNAGFKLGTMELYNMVSMGYNPTLDRDTWQLGWAIGKHRDNGKFDLNTDISAFTIFTDSWKDDTSLLLKYRVLFAGEFSEGFSIYGGPTFNFLFADDAYAADNYTWYSIINTGRKNDDRFLAWVGLTAGIQLFK